MTHGHWQFSLRHLNPQPPTKGGRAGLGEAGRELSTARNGGHRWCVALAHPRPGLRSEATNIIVVATNWRGIFPVNARFTGLPVRRGRSNRCEDMRMPTAEWHGQKEGGRNGGSRIAPELRQEQGSRGGAAGSREQGATTSSVESPMRRTHAGKLAPWGASCNVRQARARPATTRQAGACGEHQHRGNG